MAEPLTWTIIDSVELICTMLDTFVGVTTSEVSVYVDLKGTNVSRRGIISILQIYVLPLHHVFLIDVHTLQGQAFTTTATDGVTSVKTILECDMIPNVFFDVRNGSDALFANFGIRLAGVQEIQLMELATRSGSRRLLDGLSRCIEKDAHLSWAEQREWKIATDKGLFKFLPERGGRHEVFYERPLAPELILYCVQSIRFLPRLYFQYQNRLSTAWMRMAIEATKNRITSTHGSDYSSQGRDIAMGPPGWY